MKVFCYFHSDDLDGWSSSAIVNKKHKNDDIEFYGYNYEDDIKLVKGYDIVYMVDCSTTSENMKFLINNNKKFVWIDHHEKKIWQVIEDINDDILGLRDKTNQHSACVLTWKYLYKNKPVPTILKYIEDVDLWKWEMKNTDEITTSLDLDCKTERDMLEKYLDNDVWNSVINIIIENGIKYINMRKQQIKQIMKNVVFVSWEGFRTAVVNTPIHKSHTGDAILKKYMNINIVLIWSYNKDTVSCSLRSSDVDVSKIADKYGGGGHRLASGFRCNLGMIRKIIYKKHHQHLYMYHKR